MKQDVGSCEWVFVPALGRGSVSICPIFSPFINNTICLVMYGESNSKDIYELMDILCILEQGFTWVWILTHQITAFGTLRLSPLWNGMVIIRVVVWVDWLIQSTEPGILVPVNPLMLAFILFLMYRCIIIIVVVETVLKSISSWWAGVWSPSQYLGNLCVFFVIFMNS